jgi:hypothetical protein
MQAAAQRERHGPSPAAIGANARFSGALLAGRVITQQPRLRRGSYQIHLTQANKHTPHWSIPALQSLQCLPIVTYLQRC